MIGRAADRLLAFAPLVAVLAICGAPLLLLVRVALIEDGAPSFGPILDALDSRSAQRALWNSLESATISAVAATLLGAVFAVAVGLTDIRAKGALVFMLLLPLMIPPHVTAIAWLQAVGPSSPVLRPLGLAPPPGSNPLHGGFGVVLLLSLQHAPLAFLTIRAALRALPREMSDAARIAGAPPLRMLRRVALPLIAPALIAAATLCFVAALGNFGTAALLGVPGRYTTLPVLIWSRLASFGPSVLTAAAALSVLIGAVALTALALQGIATRRAGVALSGLPQPAMALRLGRARPWVEAAFWLFIAATLVLPLTALVATALLPTYGVPLTAETITFRNFVEVAFEQGSTARAFVNSTLISGVAALTLAALAIAIGFQLAQGGGGRVERWAAGAARAIGDAAYSVPGVVVAIAMVLAFLRPLPLVGVSIYNTIWIIGVAYLVAFLAIALKPVEAASAQLDPNLDAAARVAGAGPLRRLRRIYAPLVAPSAASGALLVFLTAYNEITISALLWSAGSETIGSTILNYEDGGYTVLAAAMATLTVAATVLLMLVLDAAGRRLPPGVVPWRD